MKLQTGLGWGPAWAGNWVLEAEQEGATEKTRGSFQVGGGVGGEGGGRGGRGEEQGVEARQGRGRSAGRWGEEVGGRGVTGEIAGSGWAHRAP